MTEDVSWICSLYFRLVNFTGEEVLEVRVNVSSTDNLAGYRHSATVVLSFLVQIYLDGSFSFFNRTRIFFPSFK